MLRKWLNRKSKLRDKRFEFLFDEVEEWVCFDCETTGLNPKVDEIVSISALKIVGNRVDFSNRLDILVRPKQKINEESIKIHRLRNCDVDNGLEINEAIEQFLHFIGGRTLVGYYVEFDIAMVNKYIKPKIGVTLPNKSIEVSALYYDKLIRPKGHITIDLRFDTIAHALDIPTFAKHSSLNDALMSALMYMKLKSL